MAFCPLGTVGNLRYRATEYGTARASVVGVAFFQARHVLANFVTGLACRFNLLPTETRARHEDLLRARNNSRLVGSLLSNLTAPVYLRARPRSPKG